MKSSMLILVTVQTMKKESKIREEIVKAIRARGGRPIKFYGCIYSESGMPDLLVCYRSRFIFIETKQKGKEARKKQELVMQSLRNAGAIGGVVDSLKNAIIYFDEVDICLDI